MRAKGISLDDEDYEAHCVGTRRQDVRRWDAAEEATLGHPEPVSPRRFLLPMLGSMMVVGVVATGALLVVIGYTSEFALWAGE